MPNSKDLFNDLTARVLPGEDREEVNSILYLLFRHAFGLSRTDILAEKEIDIHQAAALEPMIVRINRHEPVQYVIGEADFYGRAFWVNASVLIPRPETEQIIEEAMRPDSPTTGRLLDIGTGSGCLAITLVKELPRFTGTALDISERALETAKTNAIRHNVPVQLLKIDLLRDAVPLDAISLIVSNPPYVTRAEKNQMKSNVLDFEPHTALFVSDDDPLIFYRTIAAFGEKALLPEGKIIVEINERFGAETAGIFRAAGFSRVSVLRDINRKDRIVTAMF